MTGCVSASTTSRQGVSSSCFPTFKGGDQNLGFIEGGKTLVTVDRPSGLVRLWSVETGKERRSFSALSEKKKSEGTVISRAAISPNGATLAVAYAKHREILGGLGVPEPDEIRLWDLADDTERKQQNVNMTCTEDMAFSPNGRMLVTSGTVWNIATAQTLASLHERLPNGINLEAFSRDGRLLATASYDGTIHIWEVATWTERSHFKCADERTTALAFTPGGQILCGGVDTTVLAYDVLLQPADVAGSLKTAWNALIEKDARQAFTAQRQLLASPAAAVKLFAEKIKPIEVADGERLRKRIADLDDADFAIREGAVKALLELGEPCWSHSKGS